MNFGVLLAASAEGLTDSVESVPPLLGFMWGNFDHWILFLSSVCIALGVSFVCSLCEAAFLSLTPGQIEDMTERYPARGRIWKKFKSNIEKPISVILTLNTSAHTIGATIAGSQIDILFGNSWLTLFSIVFTWLMLQYTEILPKSLGVQFNSAIALTVTYPMQALIWLFTPIVWAINLLNRPFETRSTNENASTLDEIAALVGLAQVSKQIDKNQERILRETCRLHERDAVDVMIPAYEVTFISSTQTLLEAILAAHIDPHTRFPVIEGENVNKILGYVNFKEMVAWARTNPEETNVLPILRKVHFVPEKEEASDVLRLFVDHHAHIAIVQDDEKQTLGLITLEDIVEELVGDLDDELKGAVNEKAEIKVAKLPRFVNDLPESVFIIGGGTPMSTVIERLNQERPDRVWEGPVPDATLAGWLGGQFDVLPKPSEHVSCQGWDFIVRRIRQKQVFDVLILPEGQKGPLRLD